MPYNCAILAQELSYRLDLDDPSTACGQADISVLSGGAHTQKKCNLIDGKPNNGMKELCFVDGRSCEDYYWRDNDGSYRVCYWV